MARFTKYTLIFLIVLVLGGGVFLMFWDPPAPSKPVEKVIDDKRFPK